MPIQTVQEIEEEENDRLWITVQGIAHPQPRPRTIPAGKGKVRIVSTADGKALLWRNAVQGAFERGMASADWLAGMTTAPKGAKDAGGAVMSFRVSILFRMEPTKIAVAGRPATGKPDIDNLAKLVMDAMQDAGAFGKGNDPDALVCELVARKVWAGGDLTPGVTIELVRASA